MSKPAQKPIPSNEIKTSTPSNEIKTSTLANTETSQNFFFPLLFLLIKNICLQENDIK